MHCRERSDYPRRHEEHEEKEKEFVFLSSLLRALRAFVVQISLFPLIAVLPVSFSLDWRDVP